MGCAGGWEDEPGDAKGGRVGSRIVWEGKNGGDEGISTLGMKHRIWPHAQSDPWGGSGVCGRTKHGVEVGAIGLMTGGVVGVIGLMTGSVVGVICGVAVRRGDDVMKNGVLEVNHGGESDGATGAV